MVDQGPRRSLREVGLASTREPGLARGKPQLRLLLLLVVTVALLPGCSVTNTLFRDRAAEERAAELLQLQLSVMRFADEYAARLSERIMSFNQATDDPRERLQAQSWLVSQATGAFTIAASPNPELNAIDMLVFATLSRKVIEDRWVGEEFGLRAEALLAAHRALESRIWNYSHVLLTEAQIDELRSSIEDWHRENPLLRAVPFIHLEDFAFATRAVRQGGASSGSIFAFLGIDPLSNLTPAVRELAQTRQLAERAVYYGQRIPLLVSMEAQRLVFELSVTPEALTLLDSIERIGSAAEATGQLASSLPRLLAEERAAAIEQVSGLLYDRGDQVLALVAELRSTLEVGGTASDAVREAIAAVDVLIGRFDRGDAPAAGSAPRPFDVMEYAEALRQLGDTAQQLTSLISQADSQAPGLGRASDRAVEQVVSLVDHVYWRLVQLVMLLAGVAVAGPLLYRAIARRSGRSAGTHQ